MQQVDYMSENASNIVMLHCMCVHVAEYKYVCVRAYVHALCSTTCAQYFLNLFLKSLGLKCVNEDETWPSGFLCIDSYSW